MPGSKALRLPKPSAPVFFNKMQYPMTQNDKALPRIPLGVVACRTVTPHAGSDTGKKYDPAPVAGDDRFILHFLSVDTLGVGSDSARLAVARHPELCGVLLADALLERQVDDTGWAAAFCIDDAVLPIERVDSLRDEAAAESFVARVFTCHAWRELQQAGFTVARLQAFYAQRKYLLMSRHIGTYQQVGQLLAQTAASNPADTAALDSLARQTMMLIMAALRRPTTRGGHINALSHIRGYLKNHLGAGEKIDLDEAVEWYRLGLVPLSTPLTLLRDYFVRYPHDYIEQQVYMQPYLYARFDPVAVVGAGLQNVAGQR